MCFGILTSHSRHAPAKWVYDHETLYDNRSTNAFCLFQLFQPFDCRRKPSAMTTTETAKPTQQEPEPPQIVPRSRWLRLAAITAGFRSLRIRNYRLYWVGQVISLTGTWMQTTAQAWLVLQLTNSPFALGLVVTLQFLPIT